MLAESPLVPDPAGPLDPQAARLIDSAAAETAIAAERNLRFTICIPFGPPGSTLTTRLCVRESGLREREAALPLDKGF
jgi:hypothetical protein